MKQRQCRYDFCVVLSAMRAAGEKNGFLCRNSWNCVQILDFLNSIVVTFVVFGVIFCDALIFFVSGQENGKNSIEFKKKPRYEPYRKRIDPNFSNLHIYDTYRGISRYFQALILSPACHSHTDLHSFDEPTPVQFLPK